MRVVKGSGGGGCVARMLTHRQRQIKKITRGLVKKEKGKISETVETGSSGSEASFNKGKNAKASVVKDEFQLVEEGNEAPNQPDLGHVDQGEELDQRDAVGSGVCEAAFIDTSSKTSEKRNEIDLVDEGSKAPGQPVLAHAHRGEELDQRDEIECVAEIDHFEALPKEIESEQPRSLEVSKELQAELSVNDLRQKGKRDTRNVLDEESQEALEYDHQGDRAPSNDYRGELQESISDDKPNEIYYENEGQLESELDSVVQELMSLRKWREQPRADDETFEAYTKEMDAVMKLEKKLMDLERREMKKMMGKMEQREKESKRCRERDLRRRAQEDDMCEAEAETMFKSAFCCSHKAEAEAEAMFKSAKSKVRSQIQNIDVYASLPDEVKSFKTSILGVNIQVSGQDSLFADITQGAIDIRDDRQTDKHNSDNSVCKEARHANDGEGLLQGFCTDPCKGEGYIICGGSEDDISDVTDFLAEKKMPEKQDASRSTSDCMSCTCFGVNMCQISYCGGGGDRGLETSIAEDGTNVVVKDTSHDTPNFESAKFAYMAGVGGMKAHTFEEVISKQIEEDKIAEEAKDDLTRIFMLGSTDNADENKLLLQGLSSIGRLDDMTLKIAASAPTSNRDNSKKTTDEVSTRSEAFELIQSLKQQLSGILVSMNIVDMNDADGSLKKTNAQDLQEEAIKVILETEEKIEKAFVDVRTDEEAGGVEDGGPTTLHPESDGNQGLSVDEISARNSGEVIDAKAAESLKKDANDVCLSQTTKKKGAGTRISRFLNTNINRRAKTIQEEDHERNQAQSETAEDVSKLVTESKKDTGTTNDNDQQENCSFLANCGENLPTAACTNFFHGSFSSADQTADETSVETNINDWKETTSKAAAYEKKEKEGAGADAEKRSSKNPLKKIFLTGKLQKKNRHAISSAGVAGKTATNVANQGKDEQKTESRGATNSTACTGEKDSIARNDKVLAPATNEYFSNKISATLTHVAEQFDDEGYLMCLLNQME